MSHDDIVLKDGDLYIGDEIFMAPGDVILTPHQKQNERKGRAVKTFSKPRGKRVIFTNSDIVSTSSLLDKRFEYYIKTEFKTQKIFDLYQELKNKKDNKPFVPQLQMGDIIERPDSHNTAVLKAEGSQITLFGYTAPEPCKYIEDGFLKNGWKLQERHPHATPVAPGDKFQTISGVFELERFKSPNEIHVKMPSGYVQNTTLHKIWDNIHSGKFIPIEETNNDDIPEKGDTVIDEKARRRKVSAIVDGSIRYKNFTTSTSFFYFRERIADKTWKLVRKGEEAEIEFEVGGHIEVVGNDENDIYKIVRVEKGVPPSTKLHTKHIAAHVEKQFLDNVTRADIRSGYRKYYAPGDCLPTQEKSCSLFARDYVAEMTENTPENPFTNDESHPSQSEEKTMNDAPIFETHGFVNGERIDSFNSVETCLQKIECLEAHKARLESIENKKKGIPKLIKQTQAAIDAVSNRLDELAIA